MKKKQRRFISGEKVAFLNPIDGNMSEGVLRRYLEIDEDEDQEDYRVRIEWEGKEIDTFEYHVSKLN
ncbi:hypothetical protein [Paenibacillus sinopodophylli]|uniref:hypothetical protein n=1 Tax=Paenibacillus sinopodophylli TaxID=1837342 RepID=UPI00110CF538|nr:hypothetical protein [Paenibacillus sinopodophylli]